MIITELQAETTYSVTVAAYTTKGDGARSKPKLITTTGAGNAAFHVSFNEALALFAVKVATFLSIHKNIAFKTNGCHLKKKKKKLF